MSGLAPKRLTATMRRAGGGVSRLFGGMLFLRASPTDRGSRAGWGRVPARGRIFFEGSRDRRGESYWTGEREACRGGGCAGRTGIPGRGGRSLRGGPLSSGGAAQKRVTPDGYFLMWGRALRGMSIGRKSGSEAWTRRATAGGNSPEERRTRKERRARRGEKFPAGAASGTEPCGDEKARSLFSPTGRHGIGRRKRASSGGRKKGVGAARRGCPRRPSAVSDRDGRRTVTRGPAQRWARRGGQSACSPQGASPSSTFRAFFGARAGRPVFPRRRFAVGGGVRFVSGRPPLRPAPPKRRGQGSVHLRRGVDFPRGGAVDRGRLRPTFVPARAVGARTSVPTS